MEYKEQIKLLDEVIEAHKDCKAAIETGDDGKKFSIWNLILSQREEADRILGEAAPALRKALERGEKMEEALEKVETCTRAIENPIDLLEIINSIARKALGENNGH